MHSFWKLRGSTTNKIDDATVIDLLDNESLYAPSLRCDGVYVPSNGEHQMEM